jgi:superfamily II DNA or RNA helicase
VQDARPVPALRRSSETTQLRGWQRRALSDLAEWAHDPRRPFLISAAPGAGKTRPALEFARSQLAAGRVGAIVVACPTAPLTRQWARAADRLGLDLAPDHDGPRPPAGFHGVAVTYARVARAPKRWANALPRNTLVITDEAHHLGEELTWGEAFATAFAASDRRLLLSGTPFRSDATPIPGVSYDADGVAEPDVAFTYAEAVADRVCRPVRFVAYDGTLSWQSGDDVIEAGFDTVLSTREASRRYRTAISTELPEGLPRILREADARLRTIRRDGHRDAGGLVVAADSEHARQVSRLLHDATGRVPVVVLHDDKRSARRLAEFTGSTEPWIVAVNMVSEGVDIPRLRVGVYATAAKTAMIFRQIVGRFVRVNPRRPVEPSWLYVPADPVLRGHATMIERELSVSLRRPGETDPAELDDERPERTETEPSPTPEFVPLSADVASQLTLFGGAEPLAAPGPAMERGEIATADPEPLKSDEAASGGPAFERRARLREERHRLVSEVRRRDGASHREINQWLNRKVGITSVEKATIRELERSVDLLMKRLTSRR